jgi:predicted enzyme related to lactoylglutathione lyase
MAVTVYGCNHVVIEVDDIEKAIAFYEGVFSLAFALSASANHGAVGAAYSLTTSHRKRNQR